MYVFQIYIYLLLEKIIGCNLKYSKALDFEYSNSDRRH